MIPEFYIETDKKKLDFTAIHHAIKSSYWGAYRTEEMTQSTIDNCLCFGVYLKETDVQIGFARVLTDEVVFAYIMDVIIFDGYRGMGVGKDLVSYILEYPTVKKVLTVALKTKDAHEMYRPFGFDSVGNSSMWMAKDHAKYD